MRERLILDGIQYPLSRKMRPIPSSVTLFEWLKGQVEYPKVYWEGRGPEGARAAAGALLTFSHPPQFSGDTEATIYGGCTFSPISKGDRTWDSFPRQIHFLPRWELSTLSGVNTLITYTLDGTFPTPSPPLPIERGEALIQELAQYPDKEEWATWVQRTQRKIDKGSFLKAVLARKTELQLAGIDPFSLLEGLPQKGNCRFALAFSPGSHFIGATPERLYRREGSTLYTEALAGTRRRGAHEEEDKSLEKELLANPKERGEFSLVKASIEEALSPLLSEMSWIGEERVKKGGKVQHLYSPLTGEIRPNITDQMLLSALHPTAAMGGLPKKAALEHILSLEPFDRGWYASPFGFVTKEVAEYAVCIRSGLLTPSSLSLFAGAGIVEGSVAEAEWEELGFKTSHWKELLSR